jgi:hypothetical protein
MLPMSHYFQSAKPLPERIAAVQSPRWELPLMPLERPSHADRPIWVEGLNDSSPDHQGNGGCR